MTELFDIVVRRQIYIEGLKHSKANEWAKMLADLRRELETRLSLLDAEDLGDMTKTAIRKLIVDLRAIAKSKFDPWLTSLVDWLSRFVAEDADMLATLYRPYASDDPTALDDTKDRDHYAAAILAPMAATGTLALPFLLALGPAAMVRLERLVMANWAQRATRSELKKAILGTSAANFKDGAIVALQRQAQAATNTVIQHLANQTNEAIGSLAFEFYEWISVLDNKTTLICETRDGNRYRYGQGPVPPAHINCRSTICPCRSDDPKTPNSFTDWVASQPFEFIKDALYAQRAARYDRTPAIDLSEYVGKLDLIRA